MSAPNLKATVGSGWHREDGASAVEFALLLPVLVLLIVGMVEFALAFNAQITVNHAAREGARLAAVNQYSAATVAARAQPLDPAKLSVSLSGAPGASWIVTVSYPYQLVIPLWGQQQVTLTSTAEMRSEF